MSVVVGDITIEGEKWIGVTHRGDIDKLFLEAFPSSERICAEVLVRTSGQQLAVAVELDLVDRPALREHVDAIREYMKREGAAPYDSEATSAPVTIETEPDSESAKFPGAWRCKCAAMVPGEYLRCPSCGAMRGMR